MFIFSVFQRCISHDSQCSESGGRRKTKSKKRSSSENMLSYLLSHITQEETPSHIARVLLATLDKIDSEVCTCSSVRNVFVSPKVHV